MEGSLSAGVALFVAVASLVNKIINFMKVGEALGATTLSIMGLFATFSITTLCIECHNAG